MNSSLALSFQFLSLKIQNLINDNEKPKGLIQKGKDVTTFESETIGELWSKIQRDWEEKDI